MYVYAMLLGLLEFNKSTPRHIVYIIMLTDMFVPKDKHAINIFWKQTKLNL
jgi:hypothetical protein